MSDVDQDDIVREYENEDDDDVGDERNDDDDLVNVSGDEVKDGDGNEDEDQEQKKVVEPKKKKSTRKMVVLNTERLKGRKGVHTIEKLYEGFRFKGEGHEKEDLDRVMKRLEYWAFRLFPKLGFDDILSKCEHLGHKNDMQTHLKKYRLGMISADDNTFTQNDTIEEEDEDDATTRRNEREMLAQIANDDFQRLFDETEQSLQQAA